MFAVSPSGAIEVHQARVLQGIEYGRSGGARLLFDASLPVSQTPTDAVIIVHGGGWVRGDRRSDVAPLFSPLDNAGIAWFSIDYRLAKNVTQLGIGIPDVQSSIRYLKSNAAEYNINPDRITVLGESAGGQLAAMAILTGERATRVNGFVGIYTPSDLVALLKEAHYIPADIRKAIIGTPWEKLALGQVTKLSPLQNVRSGMPRSLLIHGTAEPLVPFSQSLTFCEAINRAGGECELFPIAGAGHGIRWWDDQTYKLKLVDWLRHC